MFTAKKTGRQVLSIVKQLQNIQFDEHFVKMTDVSGEECQLRYEEIIMAYIEAYDENTGRVYRPQMIDITEDLGGTVFLCDDQNRRFELETNLTGKKAGYILKQLALRAPYILMDSEGWLEEDVQEDFAEAERMVSIRRELKTPNLKLNKRPKIGVGFRAGLLTVAASTEKRRNGYVVWECRCDCGGRIFLDTRCLQRGTVTDCGCISRSKPGQRDITGMRFGKLVAKEPTDLRSEGTVVWRCRCDCGNEVLTSLHQLCSGYRKSCGCISHPPIKDFVGKRFGNLVVEAYGGKQDGMHRWRCRCDCGNETTVGQTLLQSGRTKSCGCLKEKIYKTNLKLIDGTSVAILEAYQKKRNRNNTSGYTGVYLDKKQGKWIAQIGFKGKTYYLGAYDDKQAAVMARRQGEEMHENFLAWYYKEQESREQENL